MISNTTVAPLYLPRIEAGLAGLHWSSFLLEDGEVHKSFAKWAAPWTHWASSAPPATPA